jgi:serine protease Do
MCNTRSRRFGRAHAGAWVLLLAGGGLALAASLCAPPAHASTGDPEAVSAAVALGDAFSTVAQEALPAVVTITSERVVATQRGPLPGGEMPGIFDDFFRRFHPDTGPQEYRQRGLGSGFIVSADGVILTCNHVVQDAQAVKVILPDGSEYAANVIGADPKTDIAILRVKADRPLPALPLGDSDGLRVGEWVLALGNPFSEGLSGTVTAGIVSAMGRSRIGLTDYEDFIQTDAAINPGNSGGPLVNLHGEVVGLNSAIAGRSGGSQGVGFAIPVNIAKMVKESILTDGRVVRGWLGIYLGELTDELREAFKIDANQGVLVQQVQKDSPAEKAGVLDGDVILELNGKPVEDVSSLRFRIAEMRPGTEVMLTLLRDGRRVSVTATLEELEADAAAAPAAESGDALARLGFEVGELTDEWRAELELDKGITGVIVTDVGQATPAADEGLRPGDVIIEVGREPVRSRSGFLRALGGIEPGQVVLLTVYSEKNHRFIAIRMPDK